MALETFERLGRRHLEFRGAMESMRKATPSEVRQRIKDAFLKVKQRGNWILPATDFFFDGTPYENIHAFAEAGQEYGQY
jgi:hypothetical protein